MLRLIDAWKFDCRTPLTRRNGAFGGDPGVALAQAWPMNPLCAGDYSTGALWHPSPPLSPFISEATRPVFLPGGATHAHASPHPNTTCDNNIVVYYYFRFRLSLYLNGWRGRGGRTYSLTRFPPTSVLTAGEGLTINRPIHGTCSRCEQPTPEAAT